MTKKDDEKNDGGTRLTEGDGISVSVHTPQLTHDEEFDAIHAWFELTYSSYLVIPRSILQSLPQGLQSRFVACLREMDELAPDDAPKNYWVRATDGHRFMRDPYSQYRHARVQLKQVGKRDQASMEHAVTVKSEAQKNSSSN